MLLFLPIRTVHVVELPTVWRGHHVLVLAGPPNRRHCSNPLLSRPNSLPQKSGVVALF